MLHIKQTHIAVLVLALAACGPSENVDEPPDAGPRFELPVEADPISCENACKRAPKCAEALVTEEDCLALCNEDANPHTYACCIQYAEGCASVQKCINGNFTKCTLEGDPWVPLQLFDVCKCGDPNKPTPKNAECINVDHDSPCETGVCMKPVVSTVEPFCAIRCGNNYGDCPPGLKCESTAKSDYCYAPFQ